VKIAAWARPGPDGKMAMRSKTICFVLVVCLSLVGADGILTENISGERVPTEKEALEAQPNPLADSNDELRSQESPKDETESEVQEEEGDPGETDELEEEHEYFDHIDSNNGGPT
jgi:hypothetical protein